MAKQNYRRFRTVFIALGIAFAALLYRYGSIMIIDAAEPPRQEDGTRVQAERGPILDRNGRILAIQTELDTVTAWTPHIENLDRALQRLASILDREVEEIAARLAGQDGYVIVARAITPTQSTAFEELKRDGELAGFSLEPDVGRSYPERDAASHVVGYVGVNNRGLNGIEYVFDDVLSPDVTAGERYGDQVILTIDVAIQHRIDELARAAMEEHDADAVMLLVADARNGDILAYSSMPNFDPNTFYAFSEDERRNRPISFIYEPGSVFKVFSIASFLELGGISMNTSYQTSGGYVNDSLDFVIRDLGDYGRIDTEGIIKYSSNVGAAYAAETVPRDAFYQMIKLFGFGEETGISLNGEERALLRRPWEWSGRTKQTVAMGQEIGVTAMQMITAATALANDGVLLQPHIVKKIVGPDGGHREEFSREPIREVVSPRTAQQIRQAMYQATRDGGTARRIAIEGIDIAAKTGTAEVFDSQAGEYSRERFIASALSMFPAEEPQVVTYIVIDHPKGESFYGGRIAVPVLRDAAEFLIPYLGIPRDGVREVTHPGRIAVSDRSLPAFDGIVPDLVGLPKRTLLPLLNEEGLDVTLHGSGWVVSQEPEAGTALKTGMSIDLYLE
ncbi:MAG: PASTA domain-containing protein [Spirochaetes bacterium]|nr:PASTA domain-containing protein [Spirochaetota bacterium]